MQAQAMKCFEKWSEFFFNEISVIYDYFTSNQLSLMFGS